MPNPLLTPDQYSYIDTKAAIEALTGLVGGERGYATDTGEEGHYDAVTSAWNWGGGGGGGAVDSVNGQVGVVVLDYSDVGADPAGSAATAQTNAEAYADGLVTLPALQMISAPTYFDTDFRGLPSALPSGFAWAGSPFVTPDTVQYESNCLYFRHTVAGASRVFLYEAAPSNPISPLVLYDYFVYQSGFYNSNNFFIVGY